MITSGLKFLQLIFDEKVPRKVYNVKSRFLSASSKNIKQGTGNIGPKTAGNREHWPKNSREQGTLAWKQPGTGNIVTPHSESQKSTVMSVWFSCPMIYVEWWQFNIGAFTWMKFLKIRSLCRQNKPVFTTELYWICVKMKWTRSYSDYSS